MKSYAVQPLLIFCLLASTGCASFFGPYVAEDRLGVATTPERPVAADVSNAGFDQAKPQAVSTHLPNNDDTEAWPETAQQPTEQSPQISDDGFEQFVLSQANSTAAVTANPFDEMQQSESSQNSVKKTSFTRNTGPVTMAGSTAASTFHPAEARVPSAATPYPEQCVCAPSPMAKAYPDEYICDGGDRDHPVHYFGGEMQGLDTEDTVAEFKDQDGKNHVKASNRVCVYAPRFGAVRTISGPGIGVKIDKASGATDIAGIGALEEQRAFESGVHQSGISGLGTNRSASGVETSQPAHASEKSDSIFQTAKIDQGLEAKTSRGLNLLRTTELHELNVHILEPGKSSQQTGFGQSESTTQATQAYSTFRIQATVGSEQGGRPGKIHITKEASPLVAKAGDIVTFTIQFRNIGDYHIHDVRIIDNLTPRLTYMAGSGQIDVGDNAGGGLTVSPNKEGSQTLIFELDEPLAGGQSGSISFRARVL